MVFHSCPFTWSTTEAQTKEERVQGFRALISKLPDRHRQLMEILFRHLKRVADHKEKNRMAASNLGVVFGPTLMKPEVETLGSISNLKYHNIVGT